MNRLSKKDFPPIREPEDGHSEHFSFPIWGCCPGPGFLCRVVILQCRLGFLERGCVVGARGGLGRAEMVRFMGHGGMEMIFDSSSPPLMVSLGSGGRKKSSQE